jgi:hypothetical protein
VAAAQHARGHVRSCGAEFRRDERSRCNITMRTAVYSCVQLMQCCRRPLLYMWPLKFSASGSPSLAGDKSAIKYKSPLNVLKYTYDHSSVVVEHVEMTIIT